MIRVRALKVVQMVGARAKRHKAVHISRHPLSPSRALSTHAHTHRRAHTHTHTHTHPSTLLLLGGAMLLATHTQTEGETDTHTHTRTQTHTAQCFSRKRDIHDFYNLNKRPVGSGGFGQVYVATHKETGEKVAVKVIPRHLTTFERIQKEVTVMREAGEHMSILSAKDQFSDDACYYIVTTYCEGGELFDRLVEEGAYSEAKASKAMREIAEAVSYLHQQGIVHGDLKPENLLLKDQTKDSGIMLVDFGASFKGGDASDLANKERGTVAYLPPEVVHKGELPSGKSDTWALGIILYILLSGFHPFDPNSNANDEELARRIGTEHDKYVVFTDECWTGVSEQAKELIRNMLAFDPAQRPTAQEVLHHPWIEGGSLLSNVPLTASAENLRRLHRGRRRLKALMLAIMTGTGPAVGEGGVSAESLGSRRAAIAILDPDDKGYVVQQDLARALHDIGEELSQEALAEMVKSGDGDPSTDQSHINHMHLINSLPPLCPGKVFKKGDVIFSEGEIDRHFYLLKKGTAKFRFAGEKTPVEVLQSGAAFGEVEMVVPSDGTVLPRSATSVCSSDRCDIIVVEDYLFALLTDVYYSTHNRLITQAERRIKKRITKWVDTITKGVIRELKAGQLLFDPEGNQQEGHRFVLVKEGTVEGYVTNEVHTKGGRAKSETLVKKYGRGTFFYTKDLDNITCSTDCMLAEVPGHVYETFLRTPGKEAIIAFLFDSQEEGGSVSVSPYKPSWLSWKGLFGGGYKKRPSEPKVGVHTAGAAAAVQ